MSDKTKRMADDARIARQMAEQRARDAAGAIFLPRCDCGHAATDGPLIAAHDRRDHVTFYCLECAPPEALDAFRNMPPTN